ncbi:MAG: hypothetical protein AB7X49_25660, partial [Geminicoccaceae bacterium]
AAAQDDADLCAGAIARTEASGALPAGLLTAVAASESGRYDRDRRGVAPWPWTVNNAGVGRYFGSKREAIAHVERLRAAGARNIDVGCMQINLLHHPDAFASLEDAFEPARNVAYGARFLRALEEETRSWDRAVERYHTADPDRGRAYRERVYQRWAGAPAEPAAPARPQVLTASLDAHALGDTAAGREPRRLRQLRPIRELGSGAQRAALGQSSRHNGFLSLRGTGDRVAVLRPSADRQLRPIVRPPRRSATTLTRLAPPRRMVASLGP